MTEWIKFHTGGSLFHEETPVTSAHGILLLKQNQTCLMENSPASCGFDIGGASTLSTQATSWCTLARWPFYIIRQTAWGGGPRSLLFDVRARVTGGSDDGYIRVCSSPRQEVFWGAAVSPQKASSTADVVNGAGWSWKDLTITLLPHNTAPSTFGTVQDDRASLTYTCVHLFLQAYVDDYASTLEIDRITVSET